MSWVEIHDEILGPKLRGLRKALDCSEAKAVGILAILWLWASKNVDDDGRLPNTDEEDIANAIRQYVGDDSPEKITTALVENGWIDKDGDSLLIHDWSEWQADAVYLQQKRSKDRQRKRQERIAAKKPKEASDPKKEEVKEEPKPKPAKKTKEPKLKFAEYVLLTQSEYDKLVEDHGEAFTQKLIETLDNYKGSSGKKYASDYRAILNWVIERCEQKYANLKKSSAQRQNSSIDMSEVDMLMSPQSSFDLQDFDQLVNRF